MHSKAQYVDGKLIGEDGKEINAVKKPPLPPPPPPVVIVEEEEPPKRKNISISYATWKAWKDIKGSKNWDAVLIDALEIFHKIKKLEDVIIEIALQKPTIIQQVSGSTPVVPARNNRVIPRTTPVRKKLKHDFLEEIMEIVDKLEEGQGIRSILTPLDEINQEDIQATDEDLVKLSEEAIKRSQGG